jgi:hypothetical protein
MKYIKLELGKKTVAEKIALGNGVATAMANNLDFPTPNPTLTGLSASITALAAKQAAREKLLEQAKTATVELQQAEKAYDQTITQLGQYAEAAVMGDTQKLENAGFTIRGVPVPLPALEQVQDLKLTSNSHTGKLFARWKPLHGAKFYEVQICPDPVSDSGWRLVKASPASNTVIEDLPSATKRWIQVRGVAKKSAGAWSQPACKVIP